MQKTRQNVEQNIIDYSEKNEKYLAEAKELGVKNLQRLCEMIKQFGWIKKELVGEDGLIAFSYLLERSKSAELQKEFLPVVITAAKKGLIGNRPIAYLMDSIRVEAGLPQIFGTQYDVRNEFFYLYPIQSETKLNSLRQSYGLLPIESFYKYAQSYLQMPVIKIPRGYQIPKSTDQVQIGLNQVEPDEESVINVQSSIVNVNIVVPVVNNAENLNLKKQDFIISEDGVEQEIKFFSDADKPTDIILISAGTLWTKDKEEIYEYARRFLKESRPLDRIGLFIYDGMSRNYLPFSTNKNFDLKDLVPLEVPPYHIGIWSELDLAISKLKNEKNDHRKIIVVVGSGEDPNLLLRVDDHEPIRNSKLTFTEIVEKIRDQEITVISIYYDRSKERERMYADVPEFARTTQTSADFLPKIPFIYKSWRQGFNTLYFLADESGGQMYRVKKLNDLDVVYSQLFKDISKTYSVGYESSNEKRDGSWRSISVKLKNSPATNVITRKGYYANK